MSKLWVIEQSATPKTIDIYIYSDVESDGYDWWTGEKIKSETSANTMLKKIQSYGEIDNINIYINSLGGSCMEGVAIYNILKRCKAYKTVYIDGFCCSVASVIAMAGDKIIMPRNTIMMIHNPWTYACGNAAELRKQADELDTMGDAFMTVYIDRAGDKLTKDELKKMLDAETVLTAEDCIKYGLADEFAEYNADLEAAKAQVAKAAKTEPKQYATSLRSIADKLDEVHGATEPQQVADLHKKQDFAETAKELLKKYLNVKGEKNA